MCATPPSRFPSWAFILSFIFFGGGFYSFKALVFSFSLSPVGEGLGSLSSASPWHGPGASHSN